MQRQHFIALCLFAGLLMVMASCLREQQADDEVFTTADADSALAYCHAQVLRVLAQQDKAVAAADSNDDNLVLTMPRNIEGNDTAWAERPVTAAEWCSGFWPGILWMDYANSGDQAVATAAVASTMAMQNIIDEPVFDHDLGFLLFCSAGTGLRVLEHELQSSDLTDTERQADSLTADYFRTMLLRAADSLATLFRPEVGTFLSWPRNTAMFGGHNTIMDNMINLELLLWAARNGGRAELRDMAIRHAETTMEHHFRSDYTSYHVAVYDSIDGHFLRGVTHQGLADSSMWARGQSWAIYGFTMMARETGDLRFLAQAQHAADVYLSRLPQDYVPYWDFNDPRIATSPEHPAPVSDSVAPRDASAAAVVASALIELSTLLDDKDAAAGYLNAARHMLASLSSEYYQSRSRNAAFLMHSTGNHPKQSEVDASIVYADYYYIEALTRLKELEN